MAIKQKSHRRQLGAYGRSMDFDPLDEMDRRRGTEEQEAALRRMVEALAADPAYEVLGELETSGWGSGQWVRYTDPDGQVHHLRVTAEEWREQSPPPGQSQI